MKKILAIVLSTVMMVGMTLSVCAAGSPSACAPVAAPTMIDGISTTIINAAAAANMTVGEYRNNVIAEMPGLAKEDVIPVGQGGHVMFNGAPTNVTFNVVKQNKATIESAKTLVAAKAKGYKVFNVLGVKGPGKFNVATVNFYTKGIKAGDKVKVYQLVNGELVEVKVNEIREDHVVVDMTQLGVLVFAISK